MKSLSILLVLSASLLVAFLLTSTAQTSQSNEMEASYEIFLASPTDYTFKCGCGLGEILDASLTPEGEMTVDYFYPCGGKKLYGKLTGSFSIQNNKFSGIYNTEDKMFYGPITFSFNERGEGRGEWDKGAGTIRMLLK